MKVLITLRPQFPSLYITNNPPSINPHKSLLSSLTPPIFSATKHHQKKLFTSIMASCVDTSQLSQQPNRSQQHDDDDHHHAYNNNNNNSKYGKHCRPSFSDRVSCMPFNRNLEKHNHVLSNIDEDDHGHDCDVDVANVDLWLKMQDEARSDVEKEPVLSSYYFTSILSHKSLESALSNHLSIKLSSLSLQSGTLYELFIGVLLEDQEIVKSVEADLRAVKERDPACISYVHCLLNFKGFLACQAHRIAHRLWSQGRKVLALLIQNRVSEVLSVDIHPGAKIGRGILLDHATGVVVGETAVIGNNVSILHNVTLGGTGKKSGDRHPKIGNGVLVGAGTCILGNIKIGDGAKIGAGSVVLREIPPRTTAVGNPARLIGGKENPTRLDKIPSFTMDQTSHIHEWSDYVI